MLLMQTFFYPELLSLIRALVVGGDAHELELMLAEGVGLVKTPSDNYTNHDLVESRDRCHVTLLSSDDVHLAPYFVSIDVTRSSAIAEGPRDASCQLKSCQLLHNCMKSRICKGLQQVNELEGQPRFLEMARFDRPYTIQHFLSMVCSNDVSVLHRFRHITILQCT